MATAFEPRIGDWYRTAENGDFEIVAVDETEQTVEIQYFDGTLEEIDLETWNQLQPVPIEPPEDWSGSLDIEREDYGVDLDGSTGLTWGNPLDYLE